MAYEIIPQHLSIKAMRSSGYRDAAHAIAELIDNSIQAGLPLKQKTAIEVLCVDREEMIARRRRRRIHSIGVYDNASGMDSATLRMALQFGNGTHLDADNQQGIGKFGMGLPNASISQCRHVDVWTWQNGRCIHSYLDIDEVERRELVQVPEPQPAELPAYWKKLIRDEIGPHGTLVAWSRLDRVKWKGSRAFLENAEFLVGRIYRYFINDGRARVRLYACEEEVRGAGSAFDNAAKFSELGCDKDVRPNDPLFLMTGTSAPVPYDAVPAFDLIGTETIEVEYESKNHPITLRYSICKPDTRTAGGHSEIGKLAKKNQGVSLVRADRELEMNSSFDNSYDPRERWWGVEVRFEPGLDEVFGVTNTKQAATAFHNMDLDEDAKAEGLPPGEYKDRLIENEDPRWALYEIVGKINRTLGTMRDQVARQKEGTRRPGEDVAPPGSVEEIATRATRKRREEFGSKGRSDKEEQKPTEEREKQLTDELVSAGLPEAEAKGIAVQAVRSNIKFLFQEGGFAGPAIFDVKSKAGTIIITLNSKHPARDHLFELLKADEGRTADPPALTALKLLLTAWARMEDEAGEERRQTLEDIRIDWGRIGRDFLKEASD